LRAATEVSLGDRLWKVVEEQEMSVSRTLERYLERPERRKLWKSRIKKLNNKINNKTE